MKAVCTKCGLVFEDKSFAMFGITGTFSNNFVVCIAPWCKGKAKLLDGVYKFDENGVATLLEGPAFTIEVLKQFEILTRRAIEENYNSEKFKEEAAKISPHLSSIFKFFSDSKKEIFLLFLGSLLTLIVDKIKEKEPSITYNITNNYYGAEPKSSNTKTKNLTQRDAIKVSKAFKAKNKQKK